MNHTSDIKTLFFDIDGTLVPFGDHQPPEEVVDTLGMLQHRGIKVFISSGRHINWIDNLGSLRPDGYVTANGNYCLEADRVTEIYRHTIPAADIDRLIDFSHQCSMPFVAVPAVGQIIINRFDEYVDSVRRQLNMPPLPLTDLEAIRGQEIVQLMMFGSEKERIDSGIFDTVLTGCNPTSWHPCFCDIVPTGSDKSIGIDKVLTHFGLKLESTMAFGDGDNDIGMLSHCSIGVAMGNSPDSVKEVADYVTTDVTDHGVINALKTFISL